MKSEDFSLELRTAIDAAKIGAEKVLEYFDKKIEIEYKEDETPVTVADRETEKTIKKFILSKYKGVKFVAEESGGSIDESEFWIIDPIDGTRSFSRGIPTWCVIVSLCRNKEIIATVVYYPNSKDMYYAEKGKGAYINNKKMNVSNVSSIENSYLGYGSPKHFENKQTIIDLIEVSGSARSWEATYSSCLVAEGKMDISVDAYGRIWDVAPFKLLVEEAGGKITRLDGSPWDIEGYGAIMTNGILHDEVVRIVNRSK